MKLTTIRMINSGNYSIANLKLDADSIQIAGRNNKGKTSLLWTLLFLFVVDRKKTTHKDYGSEESLNFYFRNPESSYIIFEGFDENQGYFYMLLKRDRKNVKYYFVKKEFKEEFLIEQNGQIKKFTKVMENPNTGLGKPLKDVSEILAKVITSKKNEVGFLRLEKDISSRRFGELYKHLFEIGSTSNDILKEGILVSLGLTNEKIDFAREIGYEDMAKWRREFAEIADLKVANKKYEEIKEKKRVYENSKVQLGLLAISYEKVDFDASMEFIKSEQIELNDKLDTDRIELEKKDGILIELNGRVQEAHTNKKLKESEQTEKKLKIELTESYGDRRWIAQELINIETDENQLEQILQKIKVVKSKDEVIKKLERLNANCRTVVKYIENNSELLLLNISESKDDISLINALLSDEVKSLSKETILKPFNKREDKNILRLNDAEIDISSIKRIEIPTKEEQEFEKLELEKEIILWESTLKAIEEQANKEDELQILKKKIFDLNKQLEAIDSLPKLQKEVFDLEIVIKQYSTEHISLKKQLEDETKKKGELDKNIKSIGVELELLDTINRNIFEFKILYSKIRKEINLKEELTQILSAEALEKLYQDKYSILEDALNKVGNKYESYLQLIELTKKDLKGIEDAYVEEDKFLEWLENKCYRLDQKEKDLENITLAKKNIFTQTIKNFIEKLGAIKSYISNTNKLIGKYSISDLSKVQILPIENTQQLKILDEISNTDKGLLSMLQDEGTSKVMDNIFLDYIRKEKIIHLSDLFSIQLNREKEGRKETSKQSNGTEKMLRVMLLLILMRGMINKEDTIPFLIDEVADIDNKNQAELLEFFKQLNLLPISASPNTSHEFEKIYHIEEIDGKSYLNDETYTKKVLYES